VLPPCFSCNGFFDLLCISLVSKILCYSLDLKSISRYKVLCLPTSCCWASKTTSPLYYDCAYSLGSCGRRKMRYYLLPPSTITRDSSLSKFLCLCSPFLTNLSPNVISSRCWPNKGEYYNFSLSSSDPFLENLRLYIHSSSRPLPNPSLSQISNYPRVDLELSDRYQRSRRLGRKIQVGTCKSCGSGLCFSSPFWHCLSWTYRWSPFYYWGYRD
jgi:hypothetical protein